MVSQIKKKNWWEGSATKYVGVVGGGLVRIK
jgi:hypothetical protein